MTKPDPSPRARPLRLLKHGTGERRLLHPASSAHDLRPSEKVAEAREADSFPVWLTRTSHPVKTTSHIWPRELYEYDAKPFVGTGETHSGLFSRSTALWRLHWVSGESHPMVVVLADPPTRQW
jgi:hypothetical protein